MLTSGNWLRVEGRAPSVRRSWGADGDVVLLIEDAVPGGRDQEYTRLQVRFRDPAVVQEFGFRIYRECYALANEMRARRDAEERRGA